MNYRTLEDVLQEVEEGTLVAGMIPAALMDFVDEANVDLVMSGLPQEVRDFVLEWAREVVFTPEDQLLHIVGQSNLSDIRPEDRRNPYRARFFDALRSWFARHPS